ncbi:MAG TPA: hypothetical protein VIZ32_02785 [Vicinamibacterales bacterium]
MTTLAAAVDRADANTSDDQWEKWIDKGKLRDIRRSKSVTAVAIVIACGFALWVTSLLFFV